VITFLSEEQLLSQSGVSFQGEEWEQAKGVLERFKKLKMIRLDNGKIVIINWAKRQENQSLSGYERVKRWRKKRAKRGIDNNDNADDNQQRRGDKIRVDKIRIDKRREKSPSYLKEIPKDDTDYFLQRFDISTKELKGKSESLLLYCESKGKTYKNYRSFLLNALKKDFKERPLEKPNVIEPDITLEQRAKNFEKLQKLKVGLKEQSII